MHRTVTRIVKIHCSNILEIFAKKRVKQKPIQLQLYVITFSLQPGLDSIELFWTDFTTEMISARTGKEEAGGGAAAGPARVSFVCQQF